MRDAPGKNEGICGINFSEGLDWTLKIGMRGVQAYTMTEKRGSVSHLDQ